MYVCYSKNCQVRANVKMGFVCCWLCENVSHEKCAGLNGRVIDLIESKKGIRWTCESCRPVEMVILAFMRHTKRGFGDLLGRFKSLLNSFAALDDDFKNLKVLNDSPKRKKANNRLSIGPNEISTPPHLFPFLYTKIFHPLLKVLLSAGTRMSIVPWILPLLIPKKFLFRRLKVQLWLIVPLVLA